MNERTSPTFASTFGTILTTIGVAIGLGNIWRLPYMMGHFGGAAFLIIFVLASFLLGLPALMAEWALGRHTRSGPLNAYKAVGFKAGKVWGIVLLIVIGGMTYYPVVIGWTLYYTGAYLMPDVLGNPATIWPAFSAAWLTQWVCALVSIAMCSVVLYLGLNRGIEFVSKIVTILFFVIFAALAWHVLSLPGAEEGFRKTFVPDWSLMTPKTLMASVGQALYGIGVGGTIMVIYGAYLRPTESIPGTATWTVVMDFISAMLAAAIIIPIVTLYNVELTSGPSLLFISVPKAFASMAWTTAVGGTFFFAVFVIAQLAMLNAMEALRQALGWTSKPALFAFTVGLGLITIPASMSSNFIFLSDLVWGSTMQPLGAVCALVAVGFFISRASALEELRRGSAVRIPAFFIAWIRYVIPAVIIGGLVYGWLG